MVAVPLSMHACLRTHTAAYMLHVFTGEGAEYKLLPALFWEEAHLQEAAVRALASCKREGGGDRVCSGVS